jgi:hypothetical protein
MREGRRKTILAATETASVARRSTRPVTSIDCANMISVLLSSVMPSIWISARASMSRRLCGAKSSAANSPVVAAKQALSTHSCPGGHSSLRSQRGAGVESGSVTHAPARSSAIIAAA